MSLYSVGQVQDRLNQIDTNTNKANYQSGQAALGNSKMTKDGFMQLLLAQLKHQDPTDPVSDKEFVQQQAALTQIEKLDELSATLKSTSQLTQAGALTGKRVTVTGSDGFDTTGTVDSVSVGKDSIALNVNGTPYTLSQVQAIYGG
jgi:flagellar basal-body rod modification protein FlgD